MVIEALAFHFVNTCFHFSYIQSSERGGRNALGIGSTRRTDGRLRDRARVPGRSPDDRPWSRVARVAGCAARPDGYTDHPTTTEDRARGLSPSSRRTAGVAGLVADVGDRVAESGPMGEWTFRELAAHLMRWRERTWASARPLPTVARIRPIPGRPGWTTTTRSTTGSRPGRRPPGHGVLADIDASHDRLAAALCRHPVEVLTDPTACPGWMASRPPRSTGWATSTRSTDRPSVPDSAGRGCRAAGATTVVRSYRPTKQWVRRRSGAARYQVRRRPGRPRASAGRSSRDRRGRVPRS